VATSLSREFPLDGRSWHALAVARSTSGDRVGAESAFLECLRLSPQDSLAWANFGFFLHKAGRSIEARDLLAKATAKFPDEGMIWTNYAEVLEALKETESAAAARRKADGLLTKEQKQSMIR